MRYIFSILLIFFLTGCASNYVKVTKFDTQGQYRLFIPAIVGGCMVEVEGDITGILLSYSSDSCIIDVKKEAPND